MSFEVISIVNIYELTIEHIVSINTELMVGCIYSDLVVSGTGSKKNRHTKQNILSGIIYCVCVCVCMSSWGRKRK